MIVIDWVSSKDHLLFNKSIFKSLALHGCKYFFFSKQLAIKEMDSRFIPWSGRLRRALKVLFLCWKFRKEQIFLITYDPFFTPLLNIFCSKLFVYEHNTTPEKLGLNKHSVWQWVFMRRVLRFTQYPAQHNQLQRLQQKSVWLGSPLREPERDFTRTDPSVFLVPSIRLDALQLIPLKKLFGKDELILKSFAIKDEQIKLLKAELNVTVSDWIDVEELSPKLKAIVVAISSRIRGSGWFNDAIMYGIPIMIIDPDMQLLFEETFPNYPFISAEPEMSRPELERQLSEINSFDRVSYIQEYQMNMRERFERALPR